MIAAKVSGAFAATPSAYSRTAEASSESGSTRVRRPMASASAAPNCRALKKMSLVCAGPMVSMKRLRPG